MTRGWERLFPSRTERAGLGLRPPRLHTADTVTDPEGRAEAPGSPGLAAGAPGGDTGSRRREGIGRGHRGSSRRPERGR